MRRSARGARGAPSRATFVLIFLALGAPALLSASCGDSSDKPANGQAGTSRNTRPTVDESHVVDLHAVRVRPVPNGNGVAQSSATGRSDATSLSGDYRETEFLFGGTAATYAGPATGPATVESADHPFVTRILVRAPATPAKFSGRVWVEPFNTSGGGEVDALWKTISPLALPRGDAWVGVTVRANQVNRLQAFDAARYTDLVLTSNAQAWDALRGIGAVLKQNSPMSPLPGYDVRHVYQGGYSQSAVDAATFASAFNGRTRLADGAPVYDGYLLGAHDSNLSPLKSADSIIPKFESATMPPVDVPVLDVEPQTDVEGFAVEVPTALLKEAGLDGADAIQTPTFAYTNVGGAKVRRADSNTSDDRYRLLEIAGAPHVTGGGGSCNGSSSFPTSAFVRAAAARLVGWAENGAAPPEVPRLELSTLGPVSAAKNDQYGNALGGVRSPFVDVPIAGFAAHSGPGPTCKLLGTETALGVDVLVPRYGDTEGYLKAFTESLDATIRAGFLLELDRQAILDAQPAHAKDAFGAT